MSKIITLKPIGTILQEADLITSKQLEIALEDQAYYEGMRLGELLALRGWIKQDTADFFVQDWFKLVSRKTAHPIGFYLNKAGLLSESDIQTILQEQSLNSLRFGDIAIQQGLLKPSTVNFFLQNLLPLKPDNVYQFPQVKIQRKPDIVTNGDMIHRMALN